MSVEHDPFRSPSKNPAGAPRGSFLGDARALWRRLREGSWLSRVDRTLLEYLAEHDTEICAAIVLSTNLSRSRVYVALCALEEDGSVSSSCSRPSPVYGYLAREYRITPRGRARLLAFYAAGGAS